METTINENFNCKWEEMRHYFLHSDFSVFFSIYFGTSLWFFKLLSFLFISFRVINFHGREHKFASINESVMWLRSFEKKEFLYENKENLTTLTFLVNFMRSFLGYRLDYPIYCHIKLKHCILYFTGVDTEFLVQLRLHHWYNIYIGYRCTATNWISGTRSYGECQPEYNIVLTWIRC